MDATAGKLEVCQLEYDYLFLNLSSLLLPFDFNFLLPWKEKTKNYLNLNSFPLHETTKRAILVFLTKKTSNLQKKDQNTTKLGEQCLTNEKNLNSPTFLLGKKRSTLKLAILILANREIENNQLFLLARDPKTSNNQNTS